MDEFFRTRMGARFFEHTMPEIATQLKRIADALEASSKEDDVDTAYDKLRAAERRQNEGMRSAAASLGLLTTESKFSPEELEIRKKLGLRTVALPDRKED